MSSPVHVPDTSAMQMHKSNPSSFPLAIYILNGHNQLRYKPDTSVDSSNCKASFPLFTVLFSWHLASMFSTFHSIIQLAYLEPFH